MIFTWYRANSPLNIDVRLKWSIQDGRPASVLRCLRMRDAMDPVPGPAPGPARRPTPSHLLSRSLLESSLPVE